MTRGPLGASFHTNLLRKLIVMIIIKYCLLFLVIFSGTSNFTTINASASRSSRQRTPAIKSSFSPMETIFEDAYTANLHTELICLIAYLTHSERKNILHRIRENNNKSTLLLQSSFSNSHPRQAAEKENMKRFLLSEKTKLQEELEIIVFKRLSNYPELKKSDFTIKTLVLLIQEKRFLEKKKLSCQVNLIIKECLRK